MTQEELEAIVLRAEVEGLTELKIDKPTTDENLLYLASQHQRLAQVRSLLFVGDGDAVSDTGVMAITERFTNLTSLHFRGWSNTAQVTDEGVRAIAERLSNLTSLTLQDSRLTDTGVEILARQLGGLTELSLSFCREITDTGISTIALKLPELNVLGIGGCFRITDTGIQRVAEGLTKLIQLSFGSNHSPPSSPITDLGLQAVGKSGLRLEKLAVSGCGEITDAGVQAVAEQFPTLQRLSLWACPQVADSSAITISQHCGDLTHLDLGLTQVSDIGVREIADRLTRLTSLNLDRCRITDVGVNAIAERLTNLTHLALGGTKLRSLPAGLRNFKRLQWLGLPQNKELGLPQELLSNPDNPAAILAHYFRGQQEGKQQLNEAKVLVVGKEAVGKTLLVRYLIGDEKCRPDERKTPGIAIDRIKVEKWPIGQQVLGGDPLQLNVWDFGGQEVMYETHRFFLSQRSLYLVVLEARREDDDSIHDWMKTIRNRAMEAPVIVVINKTEPPQDLRLDETQLRRQYPAIKGIIRTSCRTGRGIGDLRKLIGQVIADDLPHVRDWLPQSYFEVKDDLAAKAKQESVLDTHTFRELCRVRQITIDAEQDGLLRTLNEIGVVVAHRETDDSESLRNATLLDPNWVTTAVYKLLNHSAITKANGEFAFVSIGQLLEDPSRYPERWWAYIVSMMERFGLCFVLPDSKEKRYLIPEQLLPNEPHLNFDEDTALRFRFDYDFLPRGLIPRFIVQAHALYTEKPTAWLTGVVLQADRHSTTVEKGDNVSGVLAQKIRERNEKHGGCQRSNQ